MCKKCKLKVVLEDGMFGCEKFIEMLSEVECLKISKVAFKMVGLNNRFDLTPSKGIIAACYSMPISRKKELGKKMLKITIKVTFNIEDHMVESMQCLSKDNSLNLYWLFIVLLIYFDIKCSDLQESYIKGLFG